MGATFRTPKNPSNSCSLPLPILLLSSFHSSIFLPLFAPCSSFFSFFPHLTHFFFLSQISFTCREQVFGESSFERRTKSAGQFFGGVQATGFD